MRSSKSTKKGVTLKFSLKRGVGKKGDPVKVWSSLIFWISWVQNWHLLGKGILSPPFYLVPLLFDIYSFWILAYPVVNYEISNNLLVSFNRLLSFTSFTYFTYWSFCYFICYLLFYKIRDGLFDVASCLASNNYHQLK